MSKFYKLSLITIVLLISFQSIIALPARNISFTNTTTQNLEQKNLVERDLKGGEGHAYTINLAMGQFFSVDVEQKGIDIIIVLLSPDNKELTQVDSPYTNLGRESLCWVAENTGAYKLQVLSLDKNARSGKYSFQIKEIRQSNDLDKQAVAAQQAFYFGQIISEKRTNLALEEAIKKFEEAQKLWQLTDNKVKQAYALDYIARNYEDLGRQQQAFQYLEQALALEKSSGDGLMETITLNNIGLNYRSLNKLEEAINFYNQALTKTKETGDKLTQLLTLNNLIRAYTLFGDSKTAIDYSKQALLLEKEVGDSEGEARTIINICELYNLLGNKKQCLECFEEARQYFVNKGNYIGETTTLNSIGLVYQNNGEREKALEAYNKALLIAKNKSDQTIEASTLLAIGELYNSIAEKQKALDNYNKALQKALAVKDAFLQSNALNNLGLLYSSLGDKEKALAYYNKGLALTKQLADGRTESSLLHNIARTYDQIEESEKAIETLNKALKLEELLGDLRGQVYTLSFIATIYDLKKETEKALKYHNQALELARKIGDRKGQALSLSNLATNYQSKGELTKAVEQFNQALSLWKITGERSNEALMLYNLAYIERRQDKLKEALDKIKQAVEIVESIRSTVINQDLKTSYFASVQDFYELYIDLLISLHADSPKAGYDAEALKVSERAKARSLLEMLREAKADIRQGISQELLEREQILKSQLESKEQNYLRLIQRKHTLEENKIAKKELDQALSEYQNLQTEIRQKSPRYAALTQPQPVSLKEIQQELLDEDTLLLEYFLGKEKSFLWAVTKNSINAFTLPKQQEIDDLGQQLYRLLIERAESGNDLQAKRITKQELDERISNADKELPKLVVKLSKTILSPITNQMNKKRLVVVGDGSLQYVPFSVLINPNEIKNEETIFNPLINSHEIINLPSASTLVLERREQAQRKTATKNIAVMADPVFDTTDERVVNIDIKITNNVQENVSVEELRILEHVSEEDENNQKVLRIPRLKYTEIEANEIIKLVENNNYLKVSGFDATREIIAKGELSNYKYIHFATHGFLDVEKPEFSALVFSMLNSKGEAQDGFLRTHEVFNLSLPAELVVLSACETALGKEVKGEGLVGLTRAFMYAGAVRIVVSLWGVNDVATSQLMTKFYKKLILEKLPPSTALRLAQIEMIKDTDYKAAYFWAPFIIQGEWR